MIGRTVLLQFTNLIFNILPLTSLYQFKAVLLQLSGITCDRSLRLVSSARIISVNVSIGHDTFIGHQVLISGNERNKIMIGNNVDLAPRVCILSGSHFIDMIGPHSAGKGAGSDIIIEDGVWIGACSVVLPGVTIGKKAIIGAGSIVNKDIPPYCIAVGNPCKPIKFWNAELGYFVSIV